MSANASRPVILQVLPALGTGGVERGTVEITEAIVQAGGRAVVASAGGRLVAEVEAAGGEHITLPLATKNPWRIYANADVLAQLIEARRVDIVHARSRAPAWSALLACRRMKTHFLTTYHGAYGEDFPGKRWYNSVMARGERVIAISQFIARLIAERHAIDPGRIRLIPRGVDLTRFDPALVAPERLQRLARQWELPAGRPVVMLPGRLTSWKGQEVLIAALARMQRHDAIGVLVGDIAGAAEYARVLRERAERFGVADRLLLVGNCPDMPAALLLADVVACVSTRPEAFGRTVIEAQAMWRPVIGADHGGAVETIRQGRTGWRVKPGDSGELAAALDAALAQAPRAREAMLAAAREDVEAHYSTAAMQQATLAVYGELLA